MIRTMSLNPSHFPACGDVVIVGRAGATSAGSFAVLDAATDHEIASGFEQLTDAIRWAAAYAPPRAAYAIWHVNLAECGAAIGPLTYVGAVVGAES